jgi:hypothetical protein
VRRFVSSVDDVSVDPPNGNEIGEKSAARMTALTLRLTWTGKYLPVSRRARSTLVRPT